jgi:iron complex outermembrane recepter protein
LTLTIGARFARSIAEFELRQSGPIASAEFPVSGGRQKETPTTPKIGLSYDINATSMVYASATKGYRIGGGNPPLPLVSDENPAGCPLTQQPGPYQSDRLWSYEIGSKNRFLDGHASLDTSVYYTRWSDIQQSFFFSTCGFGYFTNSGSAVSKGFDFAVRALLADAFTLGLSAAYTDAYFTKSTFSFNGAPLVGRGDVIGDVGAGAPWNITASVKYAFTLSGREAYLRAENIYRSRNDGPFSSLNPLSESYSPDIPPNPATNMLNLRAGMDWSGVDLSLFLDNALDRAPTLGRYQDSRTSRLFTASTFRPRIVGVAAVFKF